MGKGTRRRTARGALKTRKQPRFPVTFLRQWRERREMTLEEAGEAVGMSHAQLGRIERGLQPYNQELLEKLSGIYKATPAMLIERDPNEADGIWSLWGEAENGQRHDIGKYAEYIIKGGKP